MTRYYTPAKNWESVLPDLEFRANVGPAVLPASPLTSGLGDRPDSLRIAARVNLRLTARWGRRFACPVIALLVIAVGACAASDLESARDRQDRPALEKLAAQPQSGDDAASHYRAALAWSYLAEVAQEQRDKGGVKRAAEAGIRAAERAVALKPDVAEYHRLLATLYGQIVPVNVLAGLSYGKKAQDEVAKALERDPKLAAAYVTRGVGNYYLPAAFGGGIDVAMRDFQKAIELNPKSDEAYLWMGLALRKTNRNGEARKAFSKSLELNPNRLWTQQQLEKTPPN